MSERNYISIKGAKVNNIKNIDVNIPRNKLVVITGLSGSGKSSLEMCIRDRYKLRVRAILMDDHHLLEERSLFITVTPPWWATLTFVL